MKQNRKVNVASNAFLNIIKQCCNIIIPLISYTYVARALGETSLGKFSFSDSVISYFTILATLGIPTYAIREGARIRDDKNEMKKFSAELFSISIVSAIFSYFILFLLIMLQPTLQRNAILLEILSINILTNVLSRDWINSIYEDFLYVTIRYILFQLISLALVILFVHSPDDLVVYTAIMMFSNSGAYISSFIYTCRRIPLQFTFKLNLKKHIKPVLFLFCSTLAIQIYVKSDITILGFLRTEAEVGVYTSASKIYTIIKALLNAIITVVIPRLSYYIGSGNTAAYQNLLEKLKNTLIAFIFPCIVGTFFLSREIIVLIGGNSYQSGSSALAILCFALFFAVMGCYYANCILIANRAEKPFFYATIVSAAANIILNIIIIPFIGMNGAAMTTVVAELIIYVICKNKAEMYVNNTHCSGIISVIVGCIGIGIICFICRQLFESMILKVVVSIIFSCLLYVAILFIGKNEIAVFAFNLVKTRKRK